MFFVVCHIYDVTTILTNITILLIITYTHEKYYFFIILLELRPGF